MPRDEVRIIENESEEEVSIDRKELADAIVDSLFSLWLKTRAPKGSRRGDK